MTLKMFLIIVCGEVMAEYIFNCQVWRYLRKISSKIFQHKMGSLIRDKGDQSYKEEQEHYKNLFFIPDPAPERGQVKYT